jgi:hypothetical protein
MLRQTLSKFYFDVPVCNLLRSALQAVPASILQGPICQNLGSIFGESPGCHTRLSKLGYSTSTIQYELGIEFELNI